MLSRIIIWGFLTLKRAFSTSTPNHEKGCISPITKRMTLHNVDDHSELRRKHTPTAIKRLSLKKYGCMIRFLYLVTTLKLCILIFMLIVNLNGITLGLGLLIPCTWGRKLNTQRQLLKPCCLIYIVNDGEPSSIIFNFTMLDFRKHSWLWVALGNKVNYGINSQSLPRIWTPILTPHFTSGQSFGGKGTCVTPLR